MSLAKQSKIKWKKQDYLTLGKAVAQFNRKINELNAEEQKTYLPSVQEYKQVKENITTRAELNRVIKSLRAFSEEGVEEIYTTEAGEQMTVWERKELAKQTQIAKRRLNTELKELKKPNEQGFSRVQMGSIEARQIEAQLKNLDKLEKKVGYEFRRLKDRIHSLGASDYSMKKAYVYRENFLSELQKLQRNSPEFKIVYDYFENITNPISFFNETQKSNALQDFFVWYQTPENYASFGTKEELGRYILKQYDVIIDDSELKSEKNKQFGLLVDNKLSMESNKLNQIVNKYRTLKKEGKQVKIIQF